MRNSKLNINWIVIFLLFFLTLPIQKILYNKRAILITSLIINLWLIIFTLYFVTNFIIKIFKYTEEYKFEISRKNIFNMSNLNNNFRFFISLFVIFLLFFLCAVFTYNSIQKTNVAYEEMSWWRAYRFYKYINFSYINKIFIMFIVALNAFLVFLICYVFMCFLIYTIIKTAIISNKNFINIIYKNSVKLNLILKSIFEKIKIKKIKKILNINYWDKVLASIIILETDKLRVHKMETDPPDRSLYF
ncbi:hypothetical protein SFLOR_v1c01200 [Spiroplasma floricola 23-6]|uniref:Transmembrane protein n=1 Tax=Spiroplasma floricola 23-6 TaxID=1336749 RepID=A0A2K8SCI5_9MOLU|nr:hypothetical protein SFLOR_v1c01200 [Spiroplasma floricola 23-6]